MEADAAGSSPGEGLLLADLRILDLTDHRGEIGPWLLGWLGAEVLRVEPPGGPLLAASTRCARTAQRTCAACSSPPTTTASARSSWTSRRTRPAHAARPGRRRRHRLRVRPARSPGRRRGSPKPISGRQRPPRPRPRHAVRGRRTARHQPASELTLAALGGPMSLQGIPERAPVKVRCPRPGAMPARKRRSPRCWRTAAWSRPARRSGWTSRPRKP